MQHAKISKNTLSAPHGVKLVSLHYAIKMIEKKKKEKECLKIRLRKFFLNINKLLPQQVSLSYFAYNI